MELCEACIEAKKSLKQIKDKKIYDWQYETMEECIILEQQRNCTCKEKEED